VTILVKNRKIGDFSHFKRGQIVGARLARAPVIKTATLLGVSRESFRSYIVIHESWEDNISEEEQWAKINIDMKTWSYNEKDFFEKSQNYCSTGELQQN
jgi:hypothetical protein